MDKHKLGPNDIEGSYAIILILVGISFLLGQNHWVNLIWQVAIIVWGVLNLKFQNFLFGVVLIAFGTVFILDMVINLNITNILIGLFFIVLGGRTLLIKMD